MILIFCDVVVRSTVLSSNRIKSMHKVEGLTNGMALGAGQHLGAGISDISGQVHQYQQFLGKATETLIYA